MMAEAGEAKSIFVQTRIASYLTKQIDALKGIKNQREIAHDLGYNRGNIISMWRSGEVKVPLEKLPALARSLGVDLGLLFRLGLEQYMPADDTSAWKTLSALNDRFVTDNELEILKCIREASNETDPHLDEDRRAALKRLFEA